MGNKLYVGNLSYNIRDEDLQQAFDFGHGYEFHVIGRYEPLAMRGLSNYALSMDTGFNIDLN